MARKNGSVAFVGDHVEQVVEDHPANHLVPAVCGHCNWHGDLKCPSCGSMNLMVDAGPQANARSALNEKLRLLLLQAHDYRNSKFFLGCFLIAIGDPAAAGETMKEYGARWGVGKAAVSKLVVRICESLGIDPGPYQKSKAAKKSYRESNRRPLKHKS